jgi:septum formation protein
VSTLILASASPRRTALLSSAGIDHTVLPVGIDESWTDGEAPIPYARRIARAKVDAAASGRSDVVVLAADTVVWCDPKEAPLGKPRDEAEARAMLGRLAHPDAPHFVTTACAIADARRDPPTVDVFEETTCVWMRRLTDEELTRYVSGGGWRDKAGGYGIQDEAAGFVTRLEGSYTNVVGLPLAQVVERLRAVMESPS